MPPIRLFSLSIPIYVAFSPTALDGNKPGHMLTGAIAYYEFNAKDPAAPGAVITLEKRILT